MWSDAVRNRFVGAAFSSSASSLKTSATGQSKSRTRMILPFGLQQIHPRNRIGASTSTKRYLLTTTTTNTSPSRITWLASSPRQVVVDSDDLFQRPAAIASAAFHSASSSSSSSSSYNNNNNSNNNKKKTKDNNFYARPLVQWYPGHIAKAERLLRDTLRLVDVVIEVRDARACVATCHPQVPLWCAGKPRVVVLTHTDAIPTSCQRTWQAYYEQQYKENKVEEEEDVEEEDDDTVNDDDDDNLVDDGHDTDASSPSSSSTQQFAQFHHSPVTCVLFVNAKEGQGIHSLQRGIVKAGAQVQQKRMNKGLKPRALRVAIIGYPNVGKSALINKLLGKRRAKTANTPGVTRALQWIRITNNNNSDKNDRNGRISKRGDPQQKQLQDLELLDSPGIIPNSLEDQSDALLLAACNCIGEASYDNQAVAAYLVDYLQALYQASPQACPDWPRISQERYGVNPMKKNMGEEEEDEQHQQQSHYPNLMTGEDFLYQVADNTCQGDPEDAARKILQDFRQGRMGLCCLQVLEQRNSRGNRSNKSKHGKDVGDKEDEDLSSTSRPAILEPLPKLYQSDSGSSMSDEELAVLRQQAKEQWDEERWRRAQLAQQVAQEQGLELPPLVQQQQQMAPVASDKDRNDSSDSQPPTPRSNSRDKGLFEGW